MSTIRDLYLRFRQLLHEGGKFLVVGGIGAVVTIVGAGLLHDATGKYGAITISTIVATVVTYLGNRYWTFTHRQSQGTARDGTMFFVLNGVGLLIYYACIWLIQDVGGLKSKEWYYVALIVGTGLGTLFRFWSYRKWVWTATPGGGRGGWPAAYGDPDPSSPDAEQPVGPRAERLPADPPSPVSQPWTGPKHRSTASRR